MVHVELWTHLLTHTQSFSNNECVHRNEREAERVTENLPIHIAHGLKVLKDDQHICT